MTKKRQYSDRPCETCDNPVGETTQRGKNYVKRFCSTRCRNINNNKIRQQTRQKTGSYCQSCGKYSFHKRKFCNKCLRWWTEEEITYLREHYPYDGATLVAKHLDRTPKQVRDKANKLHLCLTEEARRRIVHSAASEYMTNHNPMQRPEVVAKVKNWRQGHPNEVAKIMERLFKGHQELQQDKPSKLEIKLGQMLTEIGVCFDHAFFIKPKFIVDFRIENLIIQADGDYWHGHPRFEPLTERQKAQQRRDKAQDAYLQKCGYTVVRIWESELTKKHLLSILTKHDFL